MNPFMVIIFSGRIMLSVANVSTANSCDCPDETLPNLVPLGVSLMVVTAILINFGNNIQVHAHVGAQQPQTVCGTKNHNGL